MNSASIASLNPSGGPDGWKELGRCGNYDPEIWYPERDNAVAAFAVRVCKQCPVRVRCLESALAAREPYGVWGGKTEQERAKMLRAAA